MRIRSFLFVPGDRPDRMQKALTSGADALVLDLEDSVTEGAKADARRHIGEFLAGASTAVPIFVRVNAIGQGLLDLDVGALKANAPFGVILPKCEGPECVRTLDAALAGTAMMILPIVTETPRAVFAAGSYAGSTERLFGLTWGAEDLSAAVGASIAREPDGRYRPPYELARSLTLLGAHAAGVAAFETIFPDVADMAGLSAYAQRGRQDGFGGMFAIHPSQIEPIHRAFRPSDAEVAHARQIVERFAAGDGAGAFLLNGRMIDAPHLAEARRIITQSEQ